MTIDRAIDILGRYVDNDLNQADPSWVREVLCNSCSCTRDELEELGLAYIFPDDFWEEDERAQNKQEAAKKTYELEYRETNVGFFEVEADSEDAAIDEFWYQVEEGKIDLLKAYPEDSVVRVCGVLEEDR